MREELKRKEKEPSSEWIDRICDRYHIGDEIKNVMNNIYSMGVIDGFKGKEERTKK